MVGHGSFMRMIAIVRLAQKSEYLKVCHETMAGL
jgi:hypothetical protein